MLLFLSLDWIKMEHGEEPFAHENALLDLLIDLLFAERLAKDKSHSEVESCGGCPAWKQSLTTGGSKVSLSHVEQVSSSETCASKVGCFPDTLSVVESQDDSLVLLPLVVIHCSFFLL